MSDDLVVGIQLRADGSGLVGELRMSRQELDGLTGSTQESGKAAGRTGQDVNRMGREYQRGTRAVEGMNRAKTHLLRTLVAGAAAWLSFRGAARLVDDFARQEQAVARLDQTLEQTGRTTEGLGEHLNRLATDIQGRGILGDEAIIEGQAMLAIYGEISDELLPRATQVMADFAATMGGDVRSAARALGLASEGSTDILRRQGIVISDTARESGDFARILEEVESRVGGMNQALADTATGGITQMRNEIGDTRELMGGLIAEVVNAGQPQLLAMIQLINQGLTGALDDNRDAIHEWSDEMIMGVRRFALGTAGVIDTMEQPIGVLRSLVDELWTGYRSLPDWVQQVGIVGAIVGGRPGRWAVAALAAIGAVKAKVDELFDEFGAIVDPDGQPPAVIGSLFGSKEEQEDHIGRTEARLMAFFARIDEMVEERRQGRDRPSPLLPVLGEAPDDEGAGGDAAALEAFERLQQQLMSEEEALLESYQRRAQIVGEALAAREITVADANDALLRIEGDYHRRRGEMEVQARQFAVQQRQQLNMQVIGLMSALGQHGEVFGKAAMMLQAVMARNQIIAQTEVAAAAALAPPPIGLGPVAGAGLASTIRTQGHLSGAIALATGAIGAVSPSRGGGAGGGLATAQPVFSADPLTGLPSGSGSDQAQQSVVQVHLHGDVYGWDEYVERRIIDGIKHAVDDKDVVFISQSSRQAQELRD